MNLKKIFFLKRLIECYTLVNILAYVYLLIAILVSILLHLGAPFWLIVFPVIIFYHVILQVYEARTYIYEVKIEEDYLSLSFLDFNTSKNKKIKNKSLKMTEYIGGTSTNDKTLPFFKITYYDGKINKKVIRQYKIGEWKKQENIEKLKSMLNTSE